MNESASDSVMATPSQRVGYAAALHVSGVPTPTGNRQLTICRRLLHSTPPTATKPFRLHPSRFAAPAADMATQASMPIRRWWYTNRRRRHHLRRAGPSATAGPAPARRSRLYIGSVAIPDHKVSVVCLVRIHATKSAF